MKKLRSIDLSSASGVAASALLGAGAEAAAADAVLMACKAAGGGGLDARSCATGEDGTSGVTLDAGRPLNGGSVLAGRLPVSRGPEGAEDTVRVGDSKAMAAVASDGCHGGIGTKDEDGGGEPAVVIDRGRTGGIGIATSSS